MEVEAGFMPDECNALLSLLCRGVFFEFFYNKKEFCAGTHYGLQKMGGDKRL